MKNKTINFITSIMIIAIFFIILYFFVFSQHIDIKYMNGGSLMYDKFDKFDLDYTFSRIKEITHVSYCPSEKEAKVLINYRHPVSSYTEATVSEPNFKYIEINGLKNFDGIKSITLFDNTIEFVQYDHKFCGIKG